LGATIIVARTMPSQGLSVFWGEGAEESGNKVSKTSKYCVKWSPNRICMWF